jgi:type IV pilus assembly protein PilO
MEVNMGFSRREKLILGGLLVVGGLLWVLLLQPMADERARLTKEAERLIQESQNLQKALMMVQDRKAAAEDLQRRLEAIRARLLPSHNISRLLAEISRPGQGLGVRIVSVTPKAIPGPTIERQIPVQLVLEGTYLDLGRYLEALLKGPVLLTVSDLQVRSMKPGNLRLRMQLTLNAWLREGSG